LRDRKRLCRDCSIATDLFTQGWSPLLSHAENASIKLARVLSDPNRVVEHEGDQSYKFTVTINAFGRDSTVRGQVITNLMRTLHTAFNDKCHVLDVSRGRTIKFDPSRHGIGGSGEITYENGSSNGTST
jgi:hypothetical protein